MKHIQTQQDLYSPAFEHDNCGIGAVVHIKGRKSHQIVVDALKIVEKLERREGCRRQNRGRRWHTDSDFSPFFYKGLRAGPNSYRR